MLAERCTDEYTDELHIRLTGAEAGATGWAAWAVSTPLTGSLAKAGPPRKIGVFPAAVLVASSTLSGLYNNNNISAEKFEPTAFSKILVMSRVRRSVDLGWFGDARVDEMQLMSGDHSF